MWVIETDSKYCRDCYKCLKNCPVKAIKFTHNASRVVEERCVLCGSCIRTCPQGAKRDFSYLADVKALMGQNEKVVASLAPSFVSYFSSVDHHKIFSMLRRLGFQHVEETALGAYYVALATRRELEREKSFKIGTACPSSVYLIEKYFPEYIPHLSRTVSPVIAHARMIKDQYGPNTRVVFISPCAAKKYEVMEKQFQGLIDYPISFRELDEWATSEELDPAIIPDADVDREVPGFARLFPLRGGILKTADLDSGYTSTSHLAISGASNIINFLKYFSTHRYPGLKFIDFLMCEGGCINGPLGWKTLNPINRLKVTEYQVGSEAAEPPPAIDLDAFGGRQFSDRKVVYPIPSEAQISEILANIGKTNKESELDCGACGYPSCREKAIAVFQGMAEPEMCLPYMRQKAESMANQIVENTPNGVVIVNHGLKIVSVNPAFRRHMHISADEELTGRNLNHFLADVTPFVQAFAEGHFGYQKIHLEKEDRWFSLITFHMDAENFVGGIFQDLTAEEQQRRDLEKMRAEIANRTQEVILKQMRVAQEIASLLGETTAETKAMLSKLVRILTEGSAHADS
jgi:iron only hydrogenase large subunit-like protein/uncharacterized Fe-S cluster-containing protein